MKHFTLAIYITCLVISPIFIHAQTPCSAPYQVQELAAVENTLWLIGTSDEKGSGIFKYENNRWFFYPYTGAKTISVTNTNIPLVIDNNGNLMQFNGAWQNLATSVTAVFGSRNSTKIWAVINNSLKLYQNGSWVNSQFGPKIITAIDEDRIGNLYILDASGYVFKSAGTTWNILGSNKGVDIHYGYDNKLYLLDEFGGIVKYYSAGNWIDSGYKGLKLTSFSNGAGIMQTIANKVVFKQGTSTKQLTIEPINLGGEVSNNIGGAGNFNYGNNVNLIDSATGETPIFKAVTNRDVSGVYTLLSKKADLNKKNNYNQTPLIKSAILDYTDVSTALIKLKANVNVVDNGKKTALYYACERGNIETVDALLSAGATIIRSTSSIRLDPNAPLTATMRLRVDHPNKESITQALLQNGALPSKNHVSMAVNSNDSKSFKLLMNSAISSSLSSADYSSYMKTAISNKNNDIVRACLRGGADANQGLAYAMQANDRSMILFCLDKKANPSQVLQYAINLDDSELFDLLIQQYGASKNVALQKGIQSNNFTYATIALNFGADPNSGMLDAIKLNDLNFVDLLFKYNAVASKPEYIQQAVDVNNIEIIQALISKGADANNGMAMAIAKQDVNIVKLLLETADATLKEYISSASALGSHQITQMLLDGGAEPNDGMLSAVSKQQIANATLLISRGGDSTPEKLIIAAVNNDHVDMVKLLVENSANVNVGLPIAVNKNLASIAEYLILKGADFSDKELVLKVVKSSYIATLDILIKYNANLNIVDTKNNTPLHIGATIYNERLVQNLIATGQIPVDAYNNEGLTALMIAAMSGRGKTENICRMFVEEGADVNATNKEFKTVLKIANGLKVKKYLKANGAKKK